MPKKTITLIVVIVVAFFAWRKFGSGVKSAISGVTA